jgi:8-oxo-dGTP pyrophosphatase MutT (NUDIX family)
MAAIPRDSSSAILVKSDREGERVLLIRRHTDLAFAGGAWVFPGGKLEVADAAADVAQRLGLAGAPPELAALIVCACRETFEETGIVLARHPNGAFCDPSLADSLQPSRAAVSREPASFASLLVDHGLTIDAARLPFWSRWITPSSAPKRFDTRFFLGEMPPGQTVRCDSAEATELLWLEVPSDGDLPDDSIIQAPPTRFSVGDLAFCLHKHRSLARLMQCEARREVVPIMPKVLRTGQDPPMVLLPWDPDYAAAPGEGTPSTHILAQYWAFPSRVKPPEFLRGTPVC